MHRTETEPVEPVQLMSPVCVCLEGLEGLILTTIARLRF